MVRDGRRDSIPRLRRDDVAVVLVDVQEKFVPMLFQRERMVRNCTLLIKAARVMGLPIVVAEQYPQGLGQTVPELREAMGRIKPIEKMTFSTFGCGEFASALEETERNQLLICGIESHVCVIQTVMDALERDYEVFVSMDAVTSRTQLNWEAGVRRVRSLGGILVTTEMAIFELLHTAEAPEFREVQGFIKELSPISPDDYGS